MTPPEGQLSTHQLNALPAVHPPWGPRPVLYSRSVSMTLANNLHSPPLGKDEAGPIFLYTYSHPLPRPKLLGNKSALLAYCVPRLGSEHNVGPARAVRTH